MVQNVVFASNENLTTFNVFPKVGLKVKMIFLNFTISSWPTHKEITRLAQGMHLRETDLSR